MSDTLTTVMDKSLGVFLTAVAAALFVAPVAAILSSAFIGLI